MRVFGLVAIFVTATAQSCFADDAAVARRFGLLGTWAPDCAALAAPDNVHVSFSLTDEGKLLYVASPGLGLADVRHIVSDLTIIDTHRLTGTFEQADNSETTFVTVQVTDGKLQSIQSFDATGHYFIRDGHFTGPSAAPSPIEEKCNAVQS